MHGLICILSHLQQMITGWGTPAIVTCGKKAGDIATLQDLASRKADSTEVTSTLIPPMRGGGPQRQPTTKQDHQKMIESGVAQLFLNRSMDLPQVAASTTKLLDCIGLPRLHHMIVTEHGEAQQETFRRLCSAASIDLPHDPTRAQITIGKFQKLKQSQNKANPKQLALEQYQLTEGFFINQDGSTANVLQQFAPGLSGVALLDPIKAKQWLHINKPTTPDELAMYIVGQPQPQPALPSSEIHAPAVDSKGRPVLLSGLLVQFGTKPIQTKAMDSHATELRDVQLVSITMWKQDFPPETWSQILRHPIKTSRELLMTEGYSEIFGKAWGRSYRTQGVSVDAASAESVQYHTEAHRGPKFQALLKRSGFNAVYLVPKTPTGELDPTWKALWLNMTPQQLEVHSATLPGAAGLIRGAKNHGIRVESTHYTTAWQRLKPGVPLPDLRQMDRTFRLQPMPMGLDKEIISKWTSSQNWETKPLKSTGAKRWVVAANTAPHNLLVFNGQPILVQEIESKSKHQASLIAGPKIFDNRKPSAHTNDKPPGPKPGELYPDPWATYVGMRATREDSNKKPSEAASSEPRTLEGPITDRFTQQDARLSAVETALQQMKLDHDQHRAQAEHKLDRMDEKIDQQATVTKQSFDHLQKEQQSMQQCIADALSLQDNRLATAMDELKSLIIQSRGTKRAPSNQSPSDDDDLSE